MDDLRPDRHVETAEFAPVRVGGGRRRAWSPLLLVGWAALVAGAVGLGLLGQGSDAGGPGRIARGAVSPAPTRPSAPATGATHAPGLPQPVASAAPLAYVLTGDLTGLSVVGTSVAHPVVWIFISVQTPLGAVISWHSMSVEDLDGGIRPDRSPAFRAHLAIPPAQLGSPLVVEVKAYDNLGRQIGTVRSVIPVFGRGPIRVDTSVLR
jgi:hypothetical protein